MNETQEKLISERGVIILPEDMGHEAYELVLECLLRAEDSWHNTIRLFCRGDGGCSRSARAIVDLVRDHGNVAGMLAGEAHSSHAIIWAGCPRRYVYPMGMMGVHRVAVGSLNSRHDAVSLRLTADEYEEADEWMAQVISEASTLSHIYWRETLRDTGSGGIKTYSAENLIQIGLAKPVSEYQGGLIESTLSQGNTPTSSPSPIKGEGNREADDAGIVPTEGDD